MHQNRLYILSQGQKKLLMASFALENTGNVSKPSGAHQSNCCICFKTQDICMKSQSAVIVAEYMHFVIIYQLYKLVLL